MLSHLIFPRDAQVYSPLAYEGGDVGCGEEDECQRQVLNQGDVQPAVAVKLDI